MKKTHLNVNLNPNFNFFIKLGIFVLIAFCVINIFTLRSKYNSLLETEKQLRAQKEEYLEEIDRLKEELEHEMDDEYIMRIAREQLDFYLADEILFFSDR